MVVFWDETGFLTCPVGSGILVAEGEKHKMQVNYTLDFLRDEFSNTQTWTTA